ncbi:MAG: hypothetical protein QOI66_2574 [Myxococcales bacterium]|jgi:hypothetical protein|nr:hypothetical protein [Myxococcales bacterium]
MVFLRALTVSVLLAVALVVIAGGGVAHAQQVRQALLLGNDTGNDPTRGLRYAEQEVVRMGELLRRSGDFDTVEVLRGGRRADVERALTAAAGKLAAAHEAGHSTLFLFYYSGHGDNEALELGGTRLPLRDLRTYLEKLPADIRVAFVDACQSGALTGVKGGRRAPVYDLHLADTGNVRGLAVVTSSTATELSQESEDLHGSYFSNNLMAGLQGLADTSRDGQVTLAEVYDFAFRRTLANTAANLTGGQHPTYDFRMSGTGDVVLTRIRAKDGQLRFQHEAGATYTVFGHDQMSAEVIAELVTNQNEDLYLAIPAGKYRVVRRTMAGVSESTVHLVGGSAVTLQPQQMTPILVSRGDGVRKKGGRLYLPQTLEAHVGVVTSAVAGTEPLLASGGLATMLNGRALSYRAKVDVSSVAADVQGYRTSILRVTPALQLLLPVLTGDRIALLLGPSLGMPILRQTGDGATSSFGFGYGGLALAMARLTDRAWLTAALEGGGELFRVDGRRTNKAVAGLSLGGAVGF